MLYDSFFKMKRMICNATTPTFFFCSSSVDLVKCVQFDCQKHVIPQKKKKKEEEKEKENKKKENKGTDSRLRDQQLPE